MKLSIERRLLGDLVPYESNSKRHVDEDITAIQRSITAFGFNDPIAITPSGVIIEGHGRLMAAERLGMDDVPCLVIEGMSEDDYDLYRIAHNKIALTSTFDFAALYGALQDVVGTADGLVFADMGFSDRMASDLFAHFGETENETAGAPSSALEGGARMNTMAIEHDIMWDSREAKMRFNAFIAAQVAAGGDKSMGGDILLSHVKEKMPELWASVVAAVPGEQELDEIAGSIEGEREHVTT